MKFYSFNTHVGPTMRSFVAGSWEEGGVQCDEEGNPVADCRNNTISLASVEEIDPDNREHRAQLYQAYAGEEPIASASEYANWLRDEVGIETSAAERLALEAVKEPD